MAPVQTTHKSGIRLFFTLLRAIFDVLRQVRLGTTHARNANEAIADESQAAEHVEALERTLPIARAEHKAARGVAQSAVATHEAHDQRVRDRVSVILGNS